MKIFWIAVFLVIGIYIGSAGALTLSSSFDSDSKLTKIYIQPLCSALSITSLSSSINCDKEITTDFEKDSKSGVTKIDTAGIKRTIALKEEPEKPPIKITK